MNTFINFIKLVLVVNLLMIGSFIAGAWVGRASLRDREHD